MKEEGEIFKEWYEQNFEELPDPLEYVYYRDTISFQRYLLWYRYKELEEVMREELKKTFKKYSNSGLYLIGYFGKKAFDVCSWIRKGIRRRGKNKENEGKGRWE